MYFGASHTLLTRWPAVASPADLPNVMGAALQRASVRVGDTCWVTGEGYYVCTTPTENAAVWSPLALADDPRIERLTAVNQLSGTSGTLLLTHRIVQIAATNNFSLALPSVTAAAGLDFMLQRTDIANPYTLSLVRAGVSERIYFQDTADTAGTLVLTDSDNQLRPGFLLYSDGAAWWVA